MTWKNDEERKRYNREYQRHRYTPRGKYTRAFTERRRTVLRFCHEYIEKNGWVPKLVEIREACNVSKASLYRDLFALVELGYIDYFGPQRMRVLRLP